MAFGGLDIICFYVINILNLKCYLNQDINTGTCFVAIKVV